MRLQYRPEIAEAMNAANPTARRGDEQRLFGSCAVLVAGIVFLCAPPLVCAARAQERTCGPRCVRAILDWYGKVRPDLHALTDEIQGADVRRGSTFADLEAALKRRGIFTAAVEVASGSHIAWPFPAVLHLRPHVDGEFGHFIVLLPARANAEPRYEFAGPPLSADVIESRMSGALLLSAPQPIDARDIDNCLSTYPRHLRRAAIGAGLVFAFLFGAAAWRQKQIAASPMRP